MNLRGSRGTQEELEEGKKRRRGNVWEKRSLTDTLSRIYNMLCSRRLTLGLGTEYRDRSTQRGTGSSVPFTLAEGV